MRKLKIFIFNGVLLTITSLVMQTIGVSFNVYISNKIGSTAIGVYQLIMSIYMFTITLASSGMNLAITKIVAEEAHCADPLPSAAPALLPLRQTRTSETA